METDRIINETDITINIVELSCELASMELEEKWSDSIQIWEDETAEILEYTEIAQDIFNDLYDKYWTIIEQTKR